MSNRASGNAGNFSEESPMGREEIWDLMTTAPLLAQEDSDWLVSMYVDILGQLAAKLTEDELFSLLAIGTAFHQEGRRQKEA